MGRTRRYEWTYCKSFNVRLRGASARGFEEGKHLLLFQGNKGYVGINFREKGMDIATNKGKFEEYFLENNGIYYLVTKTKSEIFNGLR